MAPIVIGGVVITARLATRLGPKVISKLKKMDKSQVSSIVNRVKNLKDKGITEFKRTFFRKPKGKTRDVTAYSPARRESIKQGKDFKLRTQPKKSYGNVAEVKKKIGKKDSSVNVRVPSGQIKNISRTYGKTLGKGASRVAKRERKRALGKVAGFGGLTYLLSTLGDKPAEKKVAATQADSPKTITVKKGDTLSNIAKRTKNLTIEDLLKLNPNIKNPNKIRIGQKININMPKERKRKSVYEGFSKKQMDALDKDAKGTFKGKIVSKSYTGKKYGGKVVKRAAGGGVALRGHGAVRRI